jgi:NAD(P)-dependent dehydrogenase (short-subunit alcohol dehydrogenase family)
LPGSPRNNAAVPAAQGSPRALADLVDSDLLAAIDAKVLGYLRCARAAAPYMITQGWGRIINISGLAARSVSTPGRGHQHRPHHHRCGGG